MRLGINRQILGGLLVLLGIQGCEKENPAPAAEKPRPVKAAAATVREVGEEVTGFGSLSFVKKLDITASQEGILSQLLFREGDQVREGDVAAILKNPQIRLAVERSQDAYNQAEAALELCRSKLLEGRFNAEARLIALEKAEMEYDQARKAQEEQKRKFVNQEILFEAGAVSQESVREARFSLTSAEEQLDIMKKNLDIQRIGFREEDLKAAGLEVPEDQAARQEAFIDLALTSLQAEMTAAQANLEAAKKELESLHLSEEELIVLSPGDGIVGARYAEEGERLRKEDQIITLIDTDSLYAVFPLREEDALRVEKGMPARVVLEGPGESYEGVVNLVYPQGDSQSFSFQVRVLLIGPERGGKKLKSGMFAKVAVVVEEPRKMTLIPETALLDAGDQEGKVFIVSGSTVAGRMVGLGRKVGEDREIRSGLRPGEVVVLRPDASLKDGVYVSMAE